MSIFSGFLFFPDIKTDKPLKILLLAALVGMLAILFVAAALAPSAYVERGLPADRTIIIPRFLAVFGFVVAGWLSGLALREMFPARWLETLAVVLLLVSYAYPLYSLKVTAEKIPVYAQRAPRMGCAGRPPSSRRLRMERNASMYMPLTACRSAVFAILTRPEKPDFWITRCAMDYYDIRLRVLLP